MSKLKLMLQTPMFCYTAGKGKSLVLGVLHAFEEPGTFSVSGRKFCKLPEHSKNSQEAWEPLDTKQGAEGALSLISVGEIKLLGAAVLHEQPGMSCTWTWSCSASFLSWAGAAKG